jgi:hypothetical protein
VRRTRTVKREAKEGMGSLSHYGLIVVLAMLLLFVAGEVPRASDCQCTYYYYPTQVQGNWVDSERPSEEHCGEPELHTRVDSATKLRGPSSRLAFQVSIRRRTRCGW